MRMFDRGGLRAELLAIHAADLTSYQFEFCFALLKANMEALYNQTRFQGKGWRDGDKRRELVHADARYLLAVEPETKEPMGFLEYRVLIEDDECVFYGASESVCIELKAVSHVAFVTDSLALRQRRVVSLA